MICYAKDCVIVHVVQPLTSCITIMLTMNVILRLLFVIIDNRSVLYYYGQYSRVSPQCHVDSMTLYVLWYKC